MARSQTSSTDYANTSYTTHNSQMSFAGWFYRTGDGSSGRYFEKNAGHQFYYDLNGGNPRTRFEAHWSGGTASWRTANNTAPTVNTWAHMGCSYDDSSTANDPVIYQDGSVIGTTESVAPSGSQNTSSNAYCIGNRNSDFLRWFQGNFAACALWNRILSAAEFSALAAGFAPAFFSNGLVFDSDFFSGTAPFDKRGTGTITVSGGSTVDHPRIIYPSAPTAVIVSAAEAANVLPLFMAMFRRRRLW